jgi:hypothetical protein
MNESVDDIPQGQWPPTRNGMPDLGKYSADRFFRYVFAVSFEDGEWLMGPHRWLLANLARLTDKAVREYQEAGACLDAYVDARAKAGAHEGDFFAAGMPIEALGRLLRAADHLEDCIDAVRRAAGFLDTQIFKNSLTPEQHRNHMSRQKAVVDMRNHIQHAEERLERGVAGREGDPMFIAVHSDGVYFAGETLSYGELAARIISLWLIVTAVLSPPSEESMHESHTPA